MTRSERITNEVINSQRRAKERRFFCTLTNKGIQHVINYDAFSLFDKLSLSFKCVPPTLIIALKPVLQIGRPSAQHFNTCSHCSTRLVHDGIDTCFSINSDVTASQK
jgi:hypothetical protein